MDDAIPSTVEGQVLSLADKLDTLRECFRVGMIPTLTACTIAGIMLHLAGLVA